MSIQFSVAANYDLELIPELGKYPVHEVYGKLSHDIVGGGRPSYMGTPLGEKKLTAYVKALRNEGIEFNYLLNSSCLGNREWGRRWQRQFMNLMEKIQRMEIRRVTVSLPYLMEMVKKRFPELHVRVGIFAQVDTPSRAKFWEELGADAITLESYSINRDFERLNAIRASVACDLQLIANHVCLPNCAMQPYHQVGFAHSSDGSNGLFIDNCILRCAEKRLASPVNLIKSNWIRPEDLKAYEKIGFQSFKLLERGIPSVELLKRVKAYSLGRCEWDLADLLLSYGFSEEPKKELFWGLRHFFHPTQASPSELKPIISLAKQQGMMFANSGSPISIDNRKIPTDFLQKTSQCGGTASGCKNCTYCDEIANEAVKIDTEFLKESLAKFKKVREKITDGSLWGV